MNGKFCASLSFRFHSHSHSVFPPYHVAPRAPAALLSCAKNITITYSAAKCKQRQRAVVATPASAAASASCGIKLQTKTVDWQHTHTHTDRHTDTHTLPHSCGNRMRHSEARASCQIWGLQPLKSFLGFQLRWKNENGMENGNGNAMRLPCPALPRPALRYAMLYCCPADIRIANLSATQSVFGKCFKKAKMSYIFSVFFLNFFLLFYIFIKFTFIEFTSM